jgi:hypothetical protein
LTGAIEIRLMETTVKAYVQSLRTRFDFDVVTLELEDAKAYFTLLDELEIVPA